MNTIMARNKKTRSLWQSIKHYTRVTLFTILLIIGVAILWSFAGLFSFPFWKFLMGIAAGFLIKYVLG